MQLHGEKLLVGHGVKEAVQAIQYHYSQLFSVDQFANSRDEFTRGELGRIDLLNIQGSICHQRGDIHAKALGPFYKRAQRFVEGEDDSLLASLCGGDGVAQGDGGLSAARRADKQGAGAGVNAP